MVYMREQSMSCLTHALIVGLIWDALYSVVPVRSIVMKVWSKVTNGDPQLDNLEDMSLL
jgi:cell shape-determining protein MreD